MKGKLAVQALRIGIDKKGVLTKILDKPTDNKFTEDEIKELLESHNIPIEAYPYTDDEDGRVWKLRDISDFVNGALSRCCTIELYVAELKGNDHEMS